MQNSCIYLFITFFFNFNILMVFAISLGIRAWKIFNVIRKYISTEKMSLLLPALRFLMYMPVAGFSLSFKVDG